jgi:predicted transcriptional regulator
MATLTIRIDDRLDAELRDVAARTGTGKSAFVREAVRRQLAIARLEQLRRGVAPFAEAHGWLIDEDVFKEVS